MADLTPELVPQVIEACQQNAEELAGALGRTFDGEFVVKPGEGGAFDPAAPPEGFSGGGLAVLLKFGEQGFVALLSAESGLVPDWVKEPDPTGESKLSTLAQELSMLLVPEDLMADDSPVAWVEDLPGAVAAAAPAIGAAWAPLELIQGESIATIHLIWPLGEPDTLFGAASESSEAVAITAEELTEQGLDDAPSEPPTEESAQPAEAHGEDNSEDQTQAKAPQESPRSQILRWLGAPPSDYRDLPSNTRSVLQVLVPVAVTLAKKKHHIQEIVELGPGSILTFNKQCDGPIDLEVGGHVIAEGDPVKVGEKFGFRLREMVMPEEHFSSMNLRKESQAG